MLLALVAKVCIKRDFLENTWRAWIDRGPKVTLRGYEEPIEFEKRKVVTSVESVDEYEQNLPAKRRVVAAWKAGGNK